jgi:ABC-type transport system involved in multi-copper enzyme maturation permease subunit
MLGIHQYLWRLLPANPILLRVVETGGKRKRDLFIRCGYLGLLVFFVVILLLSGGGSIGSGKLDELAQTSGQIFQKMSYLQLALVALLAPIFTAGAITQEKDSQTYDILLATPLSNGQIVLGSLMSRLFFVIALLLSGIPIFSITQIFGGVSIASIVKSFGIAAATAFVTGSLAMAIAVFKVGTRRTIFSFYLFVVLYLVGLYLLDQLEYFHPATVDKSGTPVQLTTSWLTGLHPFLALRSIFNDPTYLPPGAAQFASDFPQLQRWPLAWYFTNPAGFYTTFMFALSLVLIAPSVLVLRRIAQSTTSLKTHILQRLKITTGDKTRKPRAVWANPIAWREAKTKASAARASMLRYGFILAGLAGAVTLLVRYASEMPPAQYINELSYRSTEKATALTIHKAAGGSETLTFDRRTKLTYQVYAPGQFNLTGASGGYKERPFSIEQVRGRMEVLNVVKDPLNRTRLASLTLRPLKRGMEADEVRKFLLGATIVEFAVILLIVTNAAASTVTREKEDGTLDILLATPITSRYYIWGKLRGLVYFVLPLIMVPVASVLLFNAWDFFRALTNRDDPTFEWLVFPEAVLILPATLIIVSAFAAILGMQMSLRLRRTVVAVMSSVGIVVGVCAALGFCGSAVMNNATSEFPLAIAAFSPFTVMTILIDPTGFAGRLFDPNFTGGNGADSMARPVLFVFSYVAVGAYTLIVWTMYKSMVKNFDMTIRRQQR